MRKHLTPESEIKTKDLSFIKECGLMMTYCCFRDLAPPEPDLTRPESTLTFNLFRSFLPPFPQTRFSEAIFGGIDVAHRRKGRGGHGLPKVSPGSAMPDPSMPCGRATRKIALQLFWGVLRPASTLLDTPRRTPKRIDVAPFRFALVVLRNCIPF
jgi:hypothetical protein